MAASRTTFFALVWAFAFATAEHNEWLTDDFIKNINWKQNLWQAARNFPVYTPMKYFKNMVGVLMDSHFENLPKFEHDVELIASLPENFDARDKWPDCPTLNEIRDQGSCNGCWAFGSVNTMTDRYCTYSNGTQHFHFSAQDLLSCCSECGFGCNGGLPSLAWEYWKNTGLVSGGSYNSSQGCRPYEVSPCEHEVPCAGDSDKIYKCQKSCEGNYKVDYHKDKRYAKHVYSIPATEDHIKAELFKNGPVQTDYTVYADFINYKSGVYKYTAGGVLGLHSVKILGWGVENGTKYWLIANSWNSDWGDNGFFKILRGENHCGIESSIIAGEPLYPN